MIDMCSRHFRRAAVEAQNTKTASFIRDQRPFGGPSNQLAYRLAERQLVTLRMRLRDLHGIFFQL
jgi:hypothetical protein